MTSSHTQDGHGAASAGRRRAARAEAGQAGRPVLGPLTAFVDAILKADRRAPRKTRKVARSNLVRAAQALEGGANSAFRNHRLFD